MSNISTSIRFTQHKILYLNNFQKKKTFQIKLVCTQPITLLPFSTFRSPWTCLFHHENDIFLPSRKFKNFFTSSTFAYILEWSSLKEFPMLDILQYFLIHMHGGYNVENFNSAQTTWKLRANNNISRKCFHCRIFPVTIRALSRLDMFRRSLLYSKYHASLHDFYRPILVSPMPHGIKSQRELHWKISSFVCDDFAFEL